VVQSFHPPVRMGLDLARAEVGILHFPELGRTAERVSYRSWVGVEEEQRWVEHSDYLGGVVVR
jgi:hypothetical protein